MSGEDTKQTLTNQLDNARKKAQSGTSTVISGLTQVATRLEMRETAARLADIQRQLDSDTFNLIVVGRINSGKSTLLNALMGGTTRSVDLGGSKGPMVVGDLPTTAIVTAVRYSVEPYIKAWSMEGKSQVWSLPRYLRESILSPNEQEDEQRFEDIRAFEMGFPAWLCEAGVVVYDSPGFDERPWRTRLTRNVAKRCDAAIMVYRGDVPMGEAELEEATGLVAEGTQLFSVINMIGNREADERLRAFVWNRYVRDLLRGPDWAGQDLASYDIFFINAQQACDARYGGDEEGVERSGLSLFERRLGGFLISERLQTHLQKFTTSATNLSASMEEHISQRMSAAKAGQKRLQEAYAAAQPQTSGNR